MKPRLPLRQATIELFTKPSGLSLGRLQFNTAHKCFCFGLLWRCSIVAVILVQSIIILMWSKACCMDTFWRTVLKWNDKQISFWFQLIRFLLWFLEVALPWCFEANVILIVLPAEWSWVHRKWDHRFLLGGRGGKKEWLFSHTHKAMFSVIYPPTLNVTILTLLLSFRYIRAMLARGKRHPRGWNEEVWSGHAALA